MIPDSDNRVNGRFVNPWQVASDTRGFGAVLHWLLFDRPRVRREQRVKPDEFAAEHPIVPSAFATPRADADALGVTWIGHSSFLLQIGGRNILTDPVWGERASPVEWIGPRRWVGPGVPFGALPPIDAVLISHNHYDHLDRPTVEQLAQRYSMATWFCPIGVAQWLRERGITTVIERDWWQGERWSAGMGPPIIVTCAPAQHFSGRGITDRNDTLWCGWVLRTPTHALYFVGDTGRHPLFSEIGRRLGPFDIVLMPIGAYDPRWFMGPVHIDPEEAVAAFGEIVAAAPNGAPPPTMVGMHWGTFRLTDEPMDEPPARTRRAWQHTPPPGYLWIPQHGETRWVTRS